MTAAAPRVNRRVEQILTYVNRTINIIAQVPLKNSLSTNLHFACSLIIFWGQALQLLGVCRLSLHWPLRMRGAQRTPPCQVTSSAPTHADVCQGTLGNLPSRMTPWTASLNAELASSKRTRVAASGRSVEEISTERHGTSISLEAVWAKDQHAVIAGSATYGR